MAFSYEQFETFVHNYYKHPESGIKECKKKLKKDPTNFLYLVRIPTPSYQMLTCEACTRPTALADSAI
jgi:hypothetical protein